MMFIKLKLRIAFSAERCFAIETDKLWRKKNTYIGYEILSKIWKRAESNEDGGYIDNGGIHLINIEFTVTISQGKTI